MVLHTVSVDWLTPWVSGRANRTNLVAAFVSLVAFGWLWETWSLLFLDAIGLGLFVAQVTGFAGSQAV
jgi:predicted PurR-regulated permease PerM